MGIVMITMKPIGHPLDFPMDFHKIYGRGACNENVEDFIQIIVDYLSEKDLICLWNLTYDEDTVIDFITNGYYNLDITVMPDGMLIIRL